MNIAIVGATGLVGQRLVGIVADKIPTARLRLFANKGVGGKMSAGNKNIPVERVERVLDYPFDYALLVATDEVSARYAPLLTKKGVVVIDNSSVFRLRPDVPLVVPCVNGHAVSDQRLIANPNCVTIQVAVAVNALLSLEPVKMTVVTYQSASGGGKDGVSDLVERRSYGKLKLFRHPLYDNVIPKIGKMTDNGYTEEEMKLVYESVKILGRDIAVNSFCARVPVTVGHCAFVNVQLQRQFTLPQIRNLLKNQQNLLLFDNGEAEVYPLPSMLRQTKYVGVGRVARDQTANGVNMFVVADNLMRGAASNAYEILQMLVDRRNIC